MLVTHAQALAMEEAVGHRVGRTCLVQGQWAHTSGTPERAWAGHRKMVLTMALAVGIAFALGRRRLIPARGVDACSEVGIVMWFVFTTGPVSTCTCRIAIRAWPMAAFAIAAFTAAGFGLIQALAAKLAENKERVSRAVALVAAPVVAAIALLPHAAAAWQKPVADRDMERAYEFLSSPPADAHRRASGSG